MIEYIVHKAKIIQDTHVQKGHIHLDLFWSVCKASILITPFAGFGAAWRWHGPDTEPFVSLPHEPLMNDSFLPSRTAPLRKELMANATAHPSTAVTRIAGGVTPTRKLQRIPCSICKRSSRTMQISGMLAILYWNSLGSSLVYFLARIIYGERIWATRHAARNLVIRPM